MWICGINETICWVEQEKYKGKSWILEDDLGQQQFQGQLEGGQQATYFILMMHGQEFLAFPAGAWYGWAWVSSKI